MRATPQTAAAPSVPVVVITKEDRQAIGLVVHGLMKAEQELAGQPIKSIPADVVREVVGCASVPKAQPILANFLDKAEGQRNRLAALVQRAEHLANQALGEPHADDNNGSTERPARGGAAEALDKADEMFCGLANRLEAAVGRLESFI